MVQIFILEKRNLSYQIDRIHIFCLNSGINNNFQPRISQKKPGIVKFYFFLIWIVYCQSQTVSRLMAIFRQKLPKKRQRFALNCLNYNFLHEYYVLSLVQVIGIHLFFKIKKTISHDSNP